MQGPERSGWSAGLLCSGALAAAAAPAHAVRQATRRDGSTVDAQEFDVDLRLVTLHKSVAQEWPFAFRQALNGRARVSYDRRSQLKDIVDGLAHRCCWRAGTPDAVCLCTGWERKQCTQGQKGV